MSKFKIGDKVRFFQIFSDDGIPEYNEGYIRSVYNSVNRYTIKIGENSFGVWVKESDITMIKEKETKRVFSEIDPYGEEDWEN